MISESTHCDKAFEKYQNILAHNDISFQRMTFSEGLKKTFRTRIACGKIDETNGRNNFSQTQITSEKLKKVETMLNRKSEKSIKIFSPAKTAVNFSPRNEEKSPFKRTGAKTHL